MFPPLMAVKITLTVLGFNHILPLDFDGFPLFFDSYLIKYVEGTLMEDVEEPPVYLVKNPCSSIQFLHFSP